MTTRPLVIRPEDLDSPGGSLTVRPEELDGTPSAEKPGPLTRLRHGLRSAMGFPDEGGVGSDLAQIGQGLKHEILHPIDSAKLIGEGMWGGQSDVADKGVARMRQPGIMPKVEGAAQYLESGVPLVGPLMSSAGESAETGDFAGMAGKMLPLAAGSEDVVSGARGTLAEAVRGAPEVGGTVGGYAAGSTMGHPYVGGYVGRELGRRVQPTADRLADVISGKPQPRGTASSRIGGEWVPDSEQTGLDATETLRGNPTPFGAKGVLSIPEATSSATSVGNTKLPKPRMSAAETGQYLRSKGQTVGSLKEDIKDPAPEPAPARGPSAFMKRKIDEAEGRHDARRMAATGAARGEDSRVGGQEGQSPSEARPVPRKAQNLQTPKAKLKDDMASKGGARGEDRLEQLRRGASGEPPAVKSVRRKFNKRETKLENRP